MKVNSIMMNRILYTRLEHLILKATALLGYLEIKFFPFVFHFIHV